MFQREPFSARRRELRYNLNADRAAGGAATGLPAGPLGPSTRRSSAGVCPNPTTAVRRVHRACQLPAGCMHGAGEKPCRIFPGDSECQSALRDAAHHAQSLRHPTIGTEDLLIGALQQKDNAATRYLESRGLTADDLVAWYRQLRTGAQAAAGPPTVRTTMTVTPAAGPAAGAVPASGPTPAAQRVLATGASLLRSGSPARLGYLLAALLVDQSVARGLLLGMGYGPDMLEAMAQECQRIADNSNSDPLSPLPHDLWVPSFA